MTSIVEGYGEVSALPILLRRVAEERGYYPVIDKPHRIRRTDFTGEGLTRAHRLQRLRADESDAGIVVVLCDSDDDDPEDLESTMAGLVGNSGITAICTAVREYETWLLAGVESIRSHRSVRDDATSLMDPESIRNAKKPLAERMTESYKETVHQVAFSQLIDLDMSRESSPSFRKFCQRLWLALDSASDTDDAT